MAIREMSQRTSARRGRGYTMWADGPWRSATRAALPADHAGPPTATVEPLVSTDPTRRTRGSLPDTLPAPTGAASVSRADRWPSRRLSAVWGRGGGVDGGVPRWDVVPLERMDDGVELDAELDVAVADVLGGCLCEAPAVEGSLEGFHVSDEVVYDRRYVGGGACVDRGAHGGRGRV